MTRQAGRSKWVKRVLLGAVVAQLAVVAVVVPPPVPGEYAASAQGNSDRSRKPRRVRDRYDDNCANLRSPFSSIKNEQFGRAAGGAVIGGLLGFMLGSQMKTQTPVYDQNGRVVGVKEGNRAGQMAVVGALAGGFTGYLSGIEKHRDNQEELRKALERHDTERGRYSELGQKLADLGNCRNQQMFDVRTQLESGTIAADVADSRLTKIEHWIAKDDEVIDKASGMDAESVTRYAQAVAVADGATAAEAETQGEQLVDQYGQGSEQLQSDVDVSYDAPGAEAQAASVEVEVPIDAFIKSRTGANVRAQPMAQAPVIASLPFQAKVGVLTSETPGWAKVAVNEQTGYVAEGLLSKAKPRAEPVVRKVVVPRPDLAPGRITVRPKTAAAPATRQAAVTKAVAQRNSLRAVDSARRNSNRQQLADTRNRVAAALQAAQS